MKAHYLILDVDGTLTDGKIYMGPQGEAFKVFDIKDGCGIHDIFPSYGGRVIVMTARTSEIVKRRCEELKIKCLYQGVRDKAQKMHEIAAEFSLQQNEKGEYMDTAYMGDDLIDLPIMRLCEHTGAPRNAAQAVLQEATFISGQDGGDGAVREFIEYLCESSLPRC